MRTIADSRVFAGLVASILAAAGPGCVPGNSGPDLPAETSLRGDPETNGELQEKLSAIINESVARCKPLKYEYDEGLLKIVDQVESHLSGKSTGAPPRFMPGLDEAEEQDHFRETIRRWESQSGRPLRAAMDPLIAEVAARKLGEAFHPEFHKRFGAVFDSFIPIEVAEARERQNREIHAKAEGLLAGYQATRPEEVKQFRAMLDRQYPVTPQDSGKPER